MCRSKVAKSIYTPHPSASAATFPSRGRLNFNLQKRFDTLIYYFITLLACAALDIK